MATIDRQRRHDERWQAEVLDGMARTLDVLHDISDGLREVSAAVARAEVTSGALPDSAHDVQVLLSIGEMSELLGVSVGTIRGLRYVGKAPTATKVGNRVMFHRRDIETWLGRQREPDAEDTRPWRGSYLPGRIGSSVPRSTEPTPMCTGSNTEPMAASRYTGRAVCRVCRDDVLVNKDGRVRKHRPFYR